MSDELTIPPDLEKMLLEYTLKVIEDDPSDLASHAADYFANLRDQRQTETQELPMEDIANMLSNRSKRRTTVMGERYNPEEDDEDDDIRVIPKSDSEKERIRSLAEAVFLFRELSAKDVDAVIDAMEKVPVKKDQVIIQQGDDGDFFYLIDSGVFHVYIKDKNGEQKYDHMYENEGCFGELALLHNQPRAATIKADTEGSLWAVDRKTFNKLIVKRAFEKRQLYMKLLDGVDELKPLSEYEKMQVADALVAKSFSPGDVIVTEGGEGDGMYFIVEGKVDVIKQKSSDGETKEEVGRLEGGDFFGELALVKHQPRAATIIAAEDTTAAFLEVKAFERLLGPCLQIMEKHAETYDKK